MLLNLNQLELYDDAKKLLLYAEKIAEHKIQPTDELIAHSIKRALVNLVADIARSSATQTEDEMERRSIKKNTIGLIHEIAASFDIAHDKGLLSDETFGKLEEKINALFIGLKTHL